MQTQNSPQIYNVMDAAEIYIVKHLQNCPYSGAEKLDPNPRSDSPASSAL